jgi:hypothetical protein
MFVFEFVQANVPPTGVLTKVVAPTVPLLQTEMFPGTVTIGVGFTVMEYVDGVPGQVFTMGVTVIVPDMGVIPEFVAVNDEISPEPPATNPIAILEFVQAKVPPVGVVPKVVEETRSLLHTEISNGTLTVGVGFTVIVYVDGVP